MQRVFYIVALGGLIASPRISAAPPEAVPAKAIALKAQAPEYPEPLARAGMTGSGTFLLHVNQRTGVVKYVTVAKSTGWRRLDECAITAFLRWRFNPPVSSVVRIPISFTDKGASIRSNKTLQATAQTASFLRVLKLIKMPKLAATCALLSRA